MRCRLLWPCQIQGRGPFAHIPHLISLCSQGHEPCRVQEPRTARARCRLEGTADRLSAPNQASARGGLKRAADCGRPYRLSAAAAGACFPLLLSVPSEWQRYARALLLPNAADCIWKSRLPRKLHVCSYTSRCTYKLHLHGARARGRRVRLPPPCCLHIRTCPGPLHLSCQKACTDCTNSACVETP